MAKYFSLILIIMFSFLNIFNVNVVYANSDLNVEIKSEEKKEDNKKNEKKDDKKEEEKTENTQSALREKILNDFKERLLRSTKGVQKTKTESIDSDFAIIIEQRNKDKLKKEQMQNKEQINKDIMDLATKPIMDDKQSEEAKEIQKNYVDAIQKEIKEKEKEQEKQIVEINNKLVEMSKTETPTLAEINKNINKNNEINKNKVDNTNNNQETLNDIFEITDTGVTEEFLQTERFQQFIKSYKMTLAKDTNEMPNVKLLKPQEKKIVDFETDDIPDELYLYCPLTL